MIYLDFNKIPSGLVFWKRNSNVSLINKPRYFLILPKEIQKLQARFPDHDFTHFRSPYILNSVLLLTVTEKIIVGNLRVPHQRHCYDFLKNIITFQ